MIKFPHKNKILFFGFLTSVFFGANIASAVCPICVVAVGSGLGLSRWLGLDDVILSIWIGALLVSMILWTLNWLIKRNWNFSYSAIVITLVYYLLTFVPLYYSGVVGHPLNTIWGIDKIIFGTVIGSILFMLTHWLNLYLKKKNNGKVFFPFQRVILPLSTLIVISIILWITT